jgi:hypothetical protein
LEYWNDGNNQKTTRFFDKAIDVFNQDFIDVLRISDFNTTGLTGSDKDYNSAWQNLVKSSGVSNKGGTSGGSFGIGKSAPFACSDLRTVFYSTIDNQGLKAFQGIARLVSFKKKKFIGDDPTTTGIGYYGVKEKNSAIRECISITNDFTRKDVGTDVFILGFSKKSDWKDEIIISVLDDFLYSVYNNKLIVKVDGIISKDTLKFTVTQYADKASKAYNYYLVLNDESTKHINYHMDKVGTIDLYVLIKPNLHRQVMMCRTNGMKVYDQKSISANIHFAGICILNDDGINQYFREMENPQHNAWKPERHSQPSDAKKRKKELTKYIKDQVLSIGRITTVDEMDAEGAGEYLADIAFQDTNNQDNAESVSSKTKISKYWSL